MVSSINKTKKMKNTILLLFGLLLTTAGFSQKMMSRTGEIKFEASMPTFEEIAATNSSVSCILEESNGEFVALALVKQFKFKSPLMEEHFNENYVESSKFPKSTFKGKILNFDASKVSSSKSTYELEGELTMHGVSKKIKTKILVSSNGGKLNVTSNFYIRPQDYNIEIPSLVKNKIAENVKVLINFALEAK